MGKGNIVSFAYNYLAFRMARDERKRARAIRGMARSRSPAAHDVLLKAVEHPEKKVRSEALRGLGEAADGETEETLIQHLDDTASDLRPEATEALGKVHTPRSVERLARALDDADFRVRESAVAALAGIGTESAIRCLIEKLRGPFDIETFPALVDALSRHGVVEAALTAAEHLDNFAAYPVQLQLCNAICRALGDRGAFYNLLGKGRISRVEAARGLLAATRKTITAKYGSGGPRVIVDRMLSFLASEAFPELVQNTASFAAAVSRDAESLDEPLRSRALAAIGILVSHVHSLRRDRVTETDWIFAVALFICLCRALCGDARKQGR